MTDNTPDELKPTETDDAGRRDEPGRGTGSKGSVVLFGERTDITPECPYCGIDLRREDAEGAWLECPSGDYAYDPESGEAYARDHGDSETPQVDLFSDEDRRTFEKAVETWGIDAQREMAEEEAAEFIVASKHVERGREDLDAVVDELADIRIMQEQLTEFVGRDRVEEQVREKMDRLRERLQEADSDE